MTRNQGLKTTSLFGMLILLLVVVDQLSCHQQKVNGLMLPNSQKTTSRLQQTTGLTRPRDNDKIRLHMSWKDPTTWFRPDNAYDKIAFETPSHRTSVSDDKAAILQVGAALDRGQAYNPTSGTYYKDRLKDAKDMVQQFLKTNPNRIPKSMDDLEGEWELVMTTYPKGIYRSSPTFLAVQEAYETYDDNQVIPLDWIPFTNATQLKKTEIFFKLHEFQSQALKVNKIGRVAHYFTNSTMYSEFDTAILNLKAIIPLMGWFKLLPEIGGSLVTASHARLEEDTGELHLEVLYTTLRKVKGLWGAGKFDWRIPVGEIWQNLPWNQNRPPVFRLFIRYSDDDFKIVEDLSGEYFVYTKPVIPRPLDLVDHEAAMTI